MKKISLYIMILFYAGAGINHFINPAFYLQIMPSWLPLHTELVFISGVAEILCALFLLFPPTRRFGAYCTIALLIAVFPANIQMMLDYYHDDNPLLWVAILRLPIQFFLIWWAYLFTKPNTVKV
ncbi:MAG: MauE/DoxX family redox-associated membrane protein [Ferruginibacter sp.]